MKASESSSHWQLKLHGTSASAGTALSGIGEKLPRTARRRAPAMPKSHSRTPDPRPNRRWRDNCLLANLLNHLATSVHSPAPNGNRARAPLRRQQETLECPWIGHAKGRFRREKSSFPEFGQGPPRRLWGKSQAAVTLGIAAVLDELVNGDLHKRSAY